MNNYTNISSRTAAKAAMAAGVVIAVGGIIQVTDTQSGEGTTVGIEHVGLGTLTAVLVLLIPAVLHLGRLAGRPTAAKVAVTGQVGLAVLTLISNVRGEDPSFFAAVAGPTNLLIFGGLVVLAVALKRNGSLPTPMAVGLGLVWILTLPLSSVGGMVVAGGYWFAVGWILEHGRAAAPERRPHRARRRLIASHNGHAAPASRRGLPSACTRGPSCLPCRRCPPITL